MAIGKVQNLNVILWTTIILLTSSIYNGCGIKIRPKKENLIIVSDSLLQKHLKFVSTQRNLNGDTIYALKTNLPQRGFINFVSKEGELYIQRGAVVMHLSKELEILDTFYSSANREFILYSYYSDNFKDSIIHIKTKSDNDRTRSNGIFSVLVYSKREGLQGIYNLNSSAYILKKYNRPLFFYFIGNQKLFNEIDTLKYMYVKIDSTLVTDRH